MVEHADDLGGFVGDDGLVHFVPESRHGEAASVVWVGGEVDLSEVGEVRMDGVWRDVFTRELFVVRNKAPA